jgi:hypothetical protein
VALFEYYHPTLENNFSAAFLSRFEFALSYYIKYLVVIMDQLSPEQRQAVLIQAQQEANQRIMQDVSGRLEPSILFRVESIDGLTQIFFFSHVADSTNGQNVLQQMCRNVGTWLLVFCQYARFILMACRIIDSCNMCFFLV